jgi:hypothetical protein
MLAPSSRAGDTRASAPFSSAGLRCCAAIPISATRNSRLCGQLIDQRRAGVFVGVDNGEAESRGMLKRKRKARATL